MSEINVYRSSPRLVREHIIRCLYAGVVPFVKSSPGMGKSSIMRSIAKELNLYLIDHRLSTSPPEDLSGLPRFRPDGKAEFSPFDIFPVEGDEIPEGYDGWLIFLDEFNSAKKDTMAAAYKIVLDKMVGQRRLHSRCLIACAGNLGTDRAIVNDIGTAMQSRVVHIEMETNFNEWLADVAIKEGYDPRIIAYLNFRNQALLDFRPDHTDSTFCCPRTWEFMNKLVTGHEIVDKDIPLYAGTITSGEAVQFVQFCKVFGSIPTIAMIIADPKATAVPNDASSRWAVISMIADKATEDNLEKLGVYADRFDMTFRILFWRMVLIRNPLLRSNPAFVKSMSELSAYLAD